MGHVYVARTTRELGSALRQARRSRGMSQADLARAARVGRPWLSSVERGKRTAEIGLVLQVLDTLRLDVTLTDRQATAHLGPVDLDAL